MKSVKRPTRIDSNVRHGKISSIVYPTQPVKKLTLEELTCMSEELDSWWAERKAALDNVVKVNNDPYATVEDKLAAIDHHLGLVSKGNTL